MKNKVIGLFILVLFVVAPFIQSDTSDESQPDILLSIPPFVSIISSYYRWIIFVLLSIYFMLTTKHLKRYVTKYNILFFLFYLFPFLYALISLVDLPRYFSLLYFGFTLPIVISSQFDDKNKFSNLKNFQKIIFFFTALSIIVSFRTTFAGLRFQGILGNANMYGISAVFWLAIIQLSKKTNLNLILTIILFLTVMLSGSRGSLVACIVVIFFSYSNYIKKLFIGSTVLTLLLVILSKFINLEFIFGRFENISNSVEESGRQDLWDKAFHYINLNPLGNGMNAPMELIGSGNIHNCYIRFLLTMGYPLTILSLLCIFLLVIFAWKDKKIPRPLIGFLIGYLLANFGEDFFVGIGSSMFIYVVLTIGLLSYYTLKQKEI